MSPTQARAAILDKLRLAGVLSPKVFEQDLDWCDVLDMVEAAFNIIARRARDSVTPIHPPSRSPCCHIGAQELEEKVRLRSQFPDPQINEVCEALRYDFDNLENRDALRVTSLGIFGPGNDRESAVGKAACFIEQLPPERRYWGWDGEVYPRFKLRRVSLR